METVGDLLEHFPRDYEIFKEPVCVKDAVCGEVCSIYASVSGMVSQKKIRNLIILNATIADRTGQMQLTFFNMPFLKKMLSPGGFYIFRGLVQTRGLDKVMEQPKIYAYDAYQRLTKQMQPRYSLTKGLTNQAVSKAVKQALSVCSMEDEFYPKQFLSEYGLIPRRDAIVTMHFPEGKELLKEARKRIVFDEFFAFLLLLQRNKDFSARLSNEYLMFETADTVRFLEQLPFCLTNAQKKVWQEIREDFTNTTCMNRLVQGDVGS